jgi:hypothetical protein
MRNSTTISSLILLVTLNSLFSQVPTSNDVPKFIPTENKPVKGNPVRQSRLVTIIENVNKPTTPSDNIVSELTDNPFIDYKVEYERLLELNERLDNNISEMKQSLDIAVQNNTSLQTKLKNLETEFLSITEERNRLFQALNDANNNSSQLRVENTNLLMEINQLSEVAQSLGTPFDGWIYSPDLGWCFVSPSTMPYFYTNDRGWVFYETGSNPRRMYFYESETWEQHE